MDYGRLEVTREEALALLFDHWEVKPLTEQIPLQQALGRVTSQDVHSKNTLPVSRCSTRDGIAVRSADFADGLPDTSEWAKGKEFVQADTGDDFPDEYDAVIPVEDIRYNDQGQLCLSDTVVSGEGVGVRAEGSLVRDGDLLVEAHARLTPVHLAVLALGGYFQVEVIRKPRVVFIPTGSELVSVGVRPDRGQNVEANGLMVSAFLEEWGAEAICFPIIKDKPAELESALDLAVNAADIVLINGGSSMGVEDFNARLLQSKASLFRHGIKAAPGRPVAIAMIDGKPVINLPGPTVATFLAMDWCVCGLVHHFLGVPAPVRQRTRVKLEGPLKKNPAWEWYWRLLLKRQDGGYAASAMANDRNIPHLLLGADALFIAPIGGGEYQAGDEVEVELLPGRARLQ
jgi:molybdopterin molybdotransferase